MEGDPKFYVLKPPLGWLSEDMGNILGAVVPNPWDPAHDYTPDDPIIYNKAPLVDVKYEDFILRKDALTSRSNEFTVNGIGKLRWARSLGPRLDLQGKVIYVRRLTQIPKFWKTMLAADHEVKDQVTEWVNEKHRLRHRYKVCLIVGLLLCQDVVVAASEQEIHERVARFEAPLGTVAEAVAASQGVPMSLGGIGNTSAETSTKSEKKTYFAAVGREKKIFALQLKIISSNLGLTDKGPKAPDDRRLGLQQPEEDELPLREPNEEEWDDLLNGDEEGGLEDEQRQGTNEKDA